MSFSVNLIQNVTIIGDTEPAHLSLQFRVFLRNATTKKYTQEKRVISYWFKVAFSPMQQASAAQDFFKQLVSPIDFPRGNPKDLKFFLLLFTILSHIINSYTISIFLFLRLRWVYQENNEINATWISNDCKDRNWNDTRNGDGLLTNQTK